MPEADHPAEPRPAHVADSGCRPQQLDDRGGAARVRLHAQMERAQPAVHEEAVERPRNRADGVLHEPQALVPLVRLRDHDAADDVRVAAEVLGGRVHDEVRPELERPLVRRASRTCCRPPRARRAGGR